MRKMTCLGIALSIFMLASAAHALPTVPIGDPSPSAQNCVQSRGLLEADEPLFVAVVSGFFHDAPCVLGAPRVIVFKYGGLDPSKRVTLDIMIDRYPKMISGVNFYEILSRLAEVLLNNPPENVTPPTSSTPPQVEKAFGYIRVNSRPDAGVWVDGKDTGLWTPVVKHRLTVGRHTIELKNTKLRCTGKYDVTIQPEQTASLIKQLDCEQ